MKAYMSGSGVNRARSRNFQTHLFVQLKKPRDFASIVDIEAKRAEGSAGVRDVQHWFS